MSISMALFSPPISSSLQSPKFIPKSSFSLLSTKRLSLLSIPRVSSDNPSNSVEATKPPAPAAPVEEVTVSPLAESFAKENGVAGGAEAKETVSNFQDARWINGTWDLKQFAIDGKTNWDAVIDAEAKRRKWLEDNPETTNNEDPVLFDTSIIPWWAWVRRYHLPEAELLNGRAAMIGFFMAYLVDSLTGVGVVGQTGNFFCKTLLFMAVSGVLVIRKNEDVENLKKLFEETTIYDKQWQAGWEDDESPIGLKKEQVTMNWVQCEFLVSVLVLYMML